MFYFSNFFWVGLTVASYLQTSEPALYRKSVAYLYGQAATMTDFHIYLYGCLALFSILLIYFFRDPFTCLSLR